MPTHPVEVQYEGGMEKLVEDLGNLRYDALEKFLYSLSQKLERDAAADNKRNRPKLADKLANASLQIGDAANNIGRAWKLSAPHMPAE